MVVGCSALLFPKASDESLCPLNIEQRRHFDFSRCAFEKDVVDHIEACLVAFPFLLSLPVPTSHVRKPLLRLIRACCAHGVHFVVENRASSAVWKWKPLARVLNRCGVDHVLMTRHGSSRHALVARSLATMPGWSASRGRAGQSDTARAKPGVDSVWAHLQPTKPPCSAFCGPLWVLLFHDRMKRRFSTRVGNDASVWCSRKKSGHWCSGLGRATLGWECASTQWSGKPVLEQLEIYEKHRAGLRRCDAKAAPTQQTSPP